MKSIRYISFNNPNIPIINSWVDFYLRYSAIIEPSYEILKTINPIQDLVNNETFKSANNRYL